MGGRRNIYANLLFLGHLSSLAVVQENKHKSNM